MNPEELANLLEEKRPEMIRMAQGRLRHHGLEYEAEDFVQDAALKILTGTHDLTEGVGGIFAHIILDLIRDRVRIEQRRTELTDEYTRIYQPDSQGQIRQRERLKLDVSLAMDHLPDDQTRRIIRLAWMEGASYKSIKRDLHISEDTISAAVKVALPILQKVLGHYCPTAIPPRVALPYLYTPKERKAVAMSIRKDRNARRPGPVTVIRYGPDGEIHVTVQTAADWRRTHRLTSRDSYKKEDRETPDSTALQAAMAGDVHSETVEELMAA